MVGLDEGVALVVNGTDDHTQGEHITEVRVALARLELDLRGDVIQVRLRHLGSLGRPRGDGERVLQ